MKIGAAAGKVIRVMLKTMKWGFIVFCVFVGSLFFRAQEIPQFLVSYASDRLLPANLVLHVDSVSFGFRHGLRVVNLRLYDKTETSAASLEPLVSADVLAVYPVMRRVEIDALAYRRLPAGYYAPGNAEKNARVDFPLPDLPRFSLVLNRPDILSVTPEKVVADIEVSGDRLSVERIRLNWPDKDEPMCLDGFCKVDLRRQEIVGEVKGTAKQRHIRPLLVTLDIPSALPYIDAFTDVPGKVPARCGWKINLVNNDFDMELDLDPTMGKYNLVPMRHANGKVVLHVYTRGQSLNYHHTIGPIVATGVAGQPLEGTVTVDGVNGTNTVTVSAKSALPVAHLLKIGGFTGEYVGEEVVGDSSCELEFRFPRKMGDDLSLLNGKGHLEIRNGQVMRMKGFQGLLELLADKVPGVAWLTDSTQASCDYVIENGVIRSDNIYIEGTLFSLKMYGAYDAVRDAMGYTVRVQFTKKDSVMGKILHPLTWPFTKLLLEFRLTGSPEKPEWKYISVIDRVLEVTK